MDPRVIFISHTPIKAARSEEITKSGGDEKLADKMAGDEDVNPSRTVVYLF